MAWANWFYMSLTANKMWCTFQADTTRILFMISQHSCTELEVVVNRWIKNFILYCKCIVLYLRVGHRGTTACAHTSALRLRLRLRQTQTAYTVGSENIYMYQAWTGHCAIVPWHRRPPSTNTGAPWPLRNFLTCALRRKILLSLWPLAYTPGRDETQWIKFN